MAKDVSSRMKFWAWPLASWRRQSRAGVFGAGLPSPVPPPSWEAGVAASVACLQYSCSISSARPATSLTAMSPSASLTLSWSGRQELVDGHAPGQRVGHQADLVARLDVFFQELDRGVDGLARAALVVEGEVEEEEVLSGERGLLRLRAGSLRRGFFADGGGARPRPVPPWAWPPARRWRAARIRSAASVPRCRKRRNHPGSGPRRDPPSGP